MTSAPPHHPSVLVFDVNETLIDIETLAPLFEAIFGDRAVLREWFAQLVIYSMAATLSETYADFFTLGRGVLHMLAEIRGTAIGDEELDRLAHAMQTMPAHPDVADGLTTLAERGYRLVTLTNSPTGDQKPSPLDNAGLAGHFERQFSVHPQRVFKPSVRLYTQVAAELGVRPSDCMMVAAHVWDLMGAQAAGFGGALITRPGNAIVPVPALPQPTVVAADLNELARLLG